MSNQETELEELKSKLKKIYIRKNKKGTFEIVKRSYTKTTDFQDTQMNAEEKEKFERIYPNTQIGAQEIYFFETKIEGKSKNITKSNIEDFLNKKPITHQSPGDIWKTMTNSDEQWIGPAGLKTIEELYLKNKEHPFFSKLVKIKTKNKDTSKKSKNKGTKIKKVKKLKLKLQFNEEQCLDKDKLEDLVEYVNSDEVKLTSAKYKEFLICKEKANREAVSKSVKYQGLYPILEDPEFNKKISLKKEFENTIYVKKTQEEIENIVKIQDKMCKNKQFELSPHQVFIRNFMSLQTPYNSLLIYHGLGTGKTCSAINVCEEQRVYYKQMGIDKQIIVVANKKVQAGFKLQLFDETKLKRINGIWNIKSCAGNNFIKEIVFTKDSKYSELDEDDAKKILSKQIKKLIKKYYKFYGYVEFSNEIGKVSSEFQLRKIESNTQQNKNKLKALRQRFNNTLIVIDEVHNIRPDTEIKGLKKTSQNFSDLVTYTENMKLLLLTGTPMFNHYSEIIWILNLLNKNDNRYGITQKDIFDADGEFIEGGKELLIKKSQGYISYLQGEDPFAFPFRLYPYDINLPDGNLIKKNSLKKRLEDSEDYYPTIQVNGAEIDNRIQKLDLFMNQLDDIQWEYYSRYIDHLTKTNKAFRSKGKTLQYTLITTPLQMTNICFPHKSFDDDDFNNWDKLSGINGLTNCFNATLKEVKKYKKLKYKSGIYKNLFDREKLKIYSKKIYNIMNIIEKSEGIVILYSNFIAGGCIPMACALEEMGFNRYNEDNILNKDQTKSQEKNGNYILLTGDVNLSKNDKQNYIESTSSKNKNGDIIKVIIISEAASEGLDFKNVRQVHILEPWFNLYRTGQIEGRGIRYKSHCELKFAKRNCLIFLHGSYHDNTIETIDLYVYRLAEKKALEIGKVTRILKENSIDCVLNEKQQDLSQEVMNKTVLIDISYQQSKPHVQNFFKIGHRKNSLICDYQDCGYKCTVDSFNGDFNDLTTFDYSFIVMSIDKIIERIKNLFQEKYVYTKNDLLSAVKSTANYTNSQVYKAIEILMSDGNEFLEDIYGKKGKIVEIGNLYFFQPIDLELPVESMYSKRMPFYYKPNEIEYTFNSNIIDLTKKEDTISNIERIYKNIMIDRDFGIIIEKEEERCQNTQGCMKLAIKKFIREEYQEVFKKLAFHTILEKLNVKKKHILFDNKDKLTPSLLAEINDFFNKFAIADNYYLIPNFKTNKLEVKRQSSDKNEISDAAIVNIARDIYNFDLTKLQGQTLVGIMDSLNRDLLFKIKKVQDITNTSKGEKLHKINGGKERLIKLFIELKNENGYEDIFKIEDDIEDDQLKDELLKIKDIDKLLSIIIELIFIYYQQEEEENRKIWFFNSVKSMLFNISNFPSYLRKDKLMREKGIELKAIHGDNYKFDEINKIQKSDNYKVLDKLIEQLI